MVVHALKAERIGVDAVSIPFSMSETHSLKNVRKDHAGMLAEIAAAASIARDHGVHFAVGLSTAFALSLGLNARDRHLLAKAALLHDVGKTKIPPAILNKPGRLDPNELTIMRTHPGIGHAMLVGSGFDAATLMVVRSHHEMLDGSGYPDGLRAAEIPDLVRLVTISDIYAALIEKRPYKAALSESAALAIIDSMVGRLDGDLVRAFRPVAGAFELAAGGGAA